MNYKEKMKDPAQHLYDHVDDRIAFQIQVVNRRNQALVFDCSVRMGEIEIGKVMMVKDHANEFVSCGSHYDKIYKKAPANKFETAVHAPKFVTLSEPLQNALVEYLFAVGVRPEIAACVEYMSWNKEQRLYMAWLREIYGYFFD